MNACTAIRAQAERNDVVEGSRLIHTLGVSSTANVDDETGAVAEH